MPAIAVNECWSAGSVRIRASVKDPYEGLKGAAYIAARKLHTPARRIAPPQVEIPQSLQRPE